MYSYIVTNNNDLYLINQYFINIFIAILLPILRFIYYIYVVLILSMPDDGYLSNSRNASYDSLNLSIINRPTPSHPHPQKIPELCEEKKDFREIP
jgi:hypothetical protein